MEVKISSGRLWLKDSSQHESDTLPKLWSACFRIFITGKHTIKKKKNQKSKLLCAIETAPQVQTSNHTRSIDSSDNALKETLFALNNIKMPTTIFNPIPTFYTQFY